MDIADYNRWAWDQQVSKGNRWTQPVTADLIADARAGRWQIVLTPKYMKGTVRGYNTELKKYVITPNDGGEDEYVYPRNVFPDKKRK